MIEKPRLGKLRAVRRPLIIPDGDSSELPAHMVALPGDGAWSLWRWVGLRGAGFPAALAQRLAAPDSASAAGEVFAAEEAARRSRSEAITLLFAACASAEEPRRAALEKAVRRLQKGKPAEPSTLGGAEREAAERFVESRARLARALADFQAAFAADELSTSAAIGEVAAMPLFREAVIWQNRRALHTCVNRLLDPGAARDSQRRQHEELAASYLLRYCMKNDTIGFFGPVGWARLSASSAVSVAEPGERLLEKRSVYFEGWCLDVLAEKLCEGGEVRPWLAPRRRPTVRVEGETLHLPFGATVKIDAAQAAVLRACDGTRMAWQVARGLARADVPGLRGEPHVYELLNRLERHGLILWKIELPVEAHPERTLRSILGRITREDLRAAALAPLDELDAARRGIEAAVGDPERLDAAIGRLEETFTRVTGRAAAGAEGQPYARALAYEDCRRDLRMEFGAEMLGQLAPPLELVLSSSRWLTHEAFAHYEGVLEELYEGAAREAGTPEVDAMTLWTEILPRFFQHGEATGDLLARRLHEKWAALLAIPEGERHAQFDSAGLRERAAAAFRVPDDAPKFVRYHSPDLMVEAESVEAMRRGDYRFVLGEIHVALNTLGYVLWLEQHPSPQEFFEARHLDIPETLVVPIYPKMTFGGAMRTQNKLSSPKDIRLDYAPELPSTTTEGSIPISELVAVRGERGVEIRHRRSGLRLDVMNLIAQGVSQVIASRFGVMPSRRHNPRVTIDRLVVARESWAFEPGEMEFAGVKGRAERFLAARRWGRAHGLPRHVFVKSPVEAKPVYVDFDSPVAVDIFAKVVRRTERESPGGPAIKVSEMLPAPGGLWLPDAQGTRYTSELRMVAVDMQGWWRASAS